MKDFFISYATPDMLWADWIAWEVEALGYETIMQRWDFAPGSNFVQAMQQAVRSCRRLLLVLSENSVGSDFVAAEWSTFFASDPVGTQRHIVPVRIDGVVPPGLLGQIVYIDLHMTNEAQARERLAGGLHLQRGKPVTAPHFPGAAGAAFTRTPKFPPATDDAAPGPLPAAEWASMVGRARLPSIHGRQFGRRFAATGLDQVIHERIAAGMLLTAVVVDVDGMGGINTSHGTAVGDIVLQRLILFCEELPGRILVARTGDDTLLTIIQGDAPAATDAAQSLLRRVAAHDWQAVRDALYVHVSAGVAEFSASREPFLVLLDASFAQMHARRLGGNRVCSIAEVDRASLADLYIAHFQSRRPPGS